MCQFSNISVSSQASSFSATSLVEAAAPLALSVVSQYDICPLIQQTVDTCVNMTSKIFSSAFSSTPIQSEIEVLNAKWMREDQDFEVMKKLKPTKEHCEKLTGILWSLSLELITQRMKVDDTELRGKLSDRATRQIFRRHGITDWCNWSLSSPEEQKLQLVRNGNEYNFLRLAHKVLQPGI